MKAEELNIYSTNGYGINIAMKKGDVAARTFGISPRVALNQTSTPFAEEQYFDRIR